MLQACVPNVSSIFQKYVANVFILGVAIWMLRMFCNDFSSVFSYVFSYVFANVQKHVSSVLFAFRHMLQMFYLDISKVDRGVAMTPMASAQQLRGPCLVLVIE
jgi:hypothetical protein